MKKVFAFIASPMGEKSCTAMFARKILEKASEKYQGDMAFEIMTADQADIKPCRGCCNCFRHCKCPQDHTDDMASIKQKMLEADFILWGSPVYANSISGQMKTLIDRISYWLHLYILAGKPGIVLCTTSASGHMEVLTYLSRIMFYLGVKAVGGYNAFVSFQGAYQDPEDVERKAEKASEVLCSYLSGNKKVVANDSMEAAFQALKKSIVYSREAKPGEYAFWEKEGYLECNSFSELLQRKVKTRKED